MESVKYICKICGKEHEEWPALAYETPNSYTDQEKEDYGELKGDFCIITYPDQTDRFIRTTLTIPVNDYCEDLDYGVWVTLSEKSFQDFSDNFDNVNYSAKYFGWLDTIPLGYDNSNSIPTTVFTRTGNQRPEIVPHVDFDHSLVTDYYDGISKEEAERRINDFKNIAS